MAKFYHVAGKMAELGFKTESVGSRGNAHDRCAAHCFSRWSKYIFPLLAGDICRLVKGQHHPWPWAFPWLPEKAIHRSYRGAHRPPLGYLIPSEVSNTSRGIEWREENCGDAAEQGGWCWNLIRVALSWRVHE